LERISVFLIGLLTCAGASAWSDAIAQDQSNSKAWATAEGGPSHVAAHLTVARYNKSAQVDYTARSLKVSDRVRIRYILETSDRESQDPGSRRNAFYINLDAGDYTLHVIAANNDRVSSTPEALAHLIMLQASYPTKSAYALCILACMVLLPLLYRIRIKLIRSQVRCRLEERLAERERIARELHDTLLQGVQALILRFQAAADILPAHEPARGAMERTLERADNLLEQSRARVKNLRDPASVLVSLQEALATEGEHLKSHYDGEIVVSAEGVPRDLHPIVREEALLIGREALVSASRHAHATRIEAEVSYGDSKLRMRIRDNGGGIDAFVLRKVDRQGHWGLLAMRERAKKLSARLEIWSTPDGGTEINLHVPAAVAYSEFGRPVRRSWWRRSDRGLFEEFQ
jgi:signal transduction histidine kinase